MSQFCLIVCDDHEFPVVRLPDQYNPGMDEWRHYLSSGRPNARCESSRRTVFVVESK